MADNFERSLRDRLGDRIADIILDIIREEPALTPAVLRDRIEHELNARIPQLDDREREAIFGILSWWITLG